MKSYDIGHLVASEHVAALRFEADRERRAASVSRRPWWRPTRQRAAQAGPSTGSAAATQLSQTAAVVCQRAAARASSQGCVA
jgi:hypothetical protein